jgi:hypothetical protein
MLPIVVNPATYLAIGAAISSFLGAGGAKNRSALNDKLKEVRSALKDLPFEQWPAQVRDGYVKLLEARNRLEPKAHTTWPFKHWLHHDATGVQREYERHKDIHAQRLKEEEEQRLAQEAQEAKRAKFDSSFKTPEIPEPLSTLGETDPKLAKAMESGPQEWHKRLPSPFEHIRMQMRGAGGITPPKDDQTPTWRGFDEIKPRETDIPVPRQEVSRETPKREYGGLPYFLDPLAQFLDKHKKEQK